MAKKSKDKIKRTLLLFIPGFFYNLIWWPARIVFNFFFHLKIETQENLNKLRGPLIIASNHAAWLDPFLIASSFPFLSEAFPIRYACWHRYFYSPRLFFFVRILGAFPIEKGLGLEKSLETPIKILENKGVVGFFPEGKRKRAGRHRKGRRGAAYLSLKTKAKILPVKIEGNMNMSFGKFLLRRNKIKIKIGKAFFLSSKKIKKPSDFNKPSALIMEKIRAL